MQNPIQEKYEIIRSESFKEKSFGIKNIANILEILRSKLYANPIDSIVRELLSNAIDANTETKSQKKIIITVPTVFHPFFSVEDFGPGISPERMTDIYLNYGESTKKDTNTAIGFFGIGAKSPFAYTESFLLQTSDGKNWREYSAYIDETRQGKVAEIQRKKSSHFGTKVQIPVKEQDFEAFKQAARKYCFFAEPRVELNNSTSIPTQNQEKEVLALCPFPGRILSHAQMAATNIPNSDNITILNGVVPYTLNKLQAQTIFPKNSNLSDLHWAFEIGLSIQFPIGALTVSASREELNLDKRNGTVIFNALKKVTCQFQKNIMERWSIRTHKTWRYHLIKMFKHLPPDLKENLVLPSLFKTTPQWHEKMFEQSSCISDTIKALKVTITDYKHMEHAKNLSNGVKETIYIRRHKITTHSPQAISSIEKQSISTNLFLGEDQLKYITVYSFPKIKLKERRIQRLFDLNPVLEVVRLLEITSIYALKHLDHSGMDYYELIPLRNLNPAQLPKRLSCSPRAPKKRLPKKSEMQRLFSESKTLLDYLKHENSKISDEEQIKMWEEPTLYLLREGKHFTFKNKLLSAFNNQRETPLHCLPNSSLPYKLFESLPRIIVLSERMKQFIPPHWIPAEETILNHLQNLKISFNTKIKLFNHALENVKNSWKLNNTVPFLILRERVARSIFNFKKLKFSSQELAKSFLVNYANLENVHTFELLPFDQSLKLWSLFPKARKFYAKVLRKYRIWVRKILNKHPELLFIDLSYKNKFFVGSKVLIQEYLRRLRKSILPPKLHIFSPQEGIYRYQLETQKNAL